VDAARTEALKALASSVFVYIESDSELSEDSSGDFNFSTSTHLSTDLPLMGVSMIAISQSLLNYARFYDTEMRLLLPRKGYATNG